MPFNGNGVYSLPAGNPVVANTTASSTVHNNTNSDIATALTNCVTKDGQSTPTANIPLGGFKLTNVGAATSVSDAVIASQIQNNGLTNLSSVSNTNTITATVTPVPSAYATGQVFTFEPANNNTGAATINISSLGAKDIYLNNAPLAADVLIAGQPVVIRYNGTQFEIIGKADFASLNAASQTFAGNVSINGNTTLGDAFSDTVTINAQAWSVPNGFAVNTDELIFDTRGNIGLAAIPSSWSSATAFQVDVGSVWNFNAADNIFIGCNYYYDGTDRRYINSAFATEYLQDCSTGVHTWSRASSGTAGNVATLTESARITPDGFFKASNTGSYSGGATGTFHEITTSISGNYIGRSYQTSIDPFGWDLAYTGATTNGTGNEFIRTRDATSTRFVLRSNGGIANYQANDVNLSDEREKTNINLAKNYLKTICSIPVKTFNYIDQNLKYDGGLTLGVIAQEVQSVAPELVHESNWGTKEEPKNRLSIYQTDLQYALMKSIQELKEINDAQKDTIEALTARIEALEAKQ